MTETPLNNVSLSFDYVVRIFRTGVVCKQKSLRCDGKDILDRLYEVKNTLDL